jgi:hypothetical protein
MAYAVRHHIVSATTCRAAGSSCEAASWTGPPSSGHTRCCSTGAWQLSTRWRCRRACTPPSKSVTLRQTSIAAQAGCYTRCNPPSFMLLASPEEGSRPPFPEYVWSGSIVTREGVQRQDQRTQNCRQCAHRVWKIKTLSGSLMVNLIAALIMPVHRAAAGNASPHTSPSPPARPIGPHHRLARTSALGLASSALRPSSFL